MADAELRNWRIKAHAHVDKYWKSGKYTRNRMYQRLNHAMGKITHIGESDIEVCKKIITIEL